MQGPAMPLPASAYLLEDGRFMVWECALQHPHQLSKGHLEATQLDLTIVEGEEGEKGTREG